MIKSDSRGRKKTMTATDVTGFDAIFSAGFFATFSRFWGARLTKLHREPGEKANWAAANGGVTNGGLRGVWPPSPEIGRNRPFSPFSCLFRPFPGGAKSTWKIQKTEEKGLFPQISSDLLKPPSLKPPFAALQAKNPVESLQWRRRPEIADFCPLSWSNVS